jgi:hypothetical protein
VPGADRARDDDRAADVLGAPVPAGLGVRCDQAITGLLAEIFEPGERGRRRPESLYGAGEGAGMAAPTRRYRDQVHGGAADARERVARQ